MEIFVKGINAPFGIKPVRTLSGTTWNGQLEEYEIYPTLEMDLYTNDPVSFDAVFSNATTPQPGYLYYAGEKTVTNTDIKITPLVGSFQGCKYIDVKGKPVYSPCWLGKTPIYPNTKVVGLVAADPNLVYQVQVSNSVAPNPNNGDYLGVPRSSLGIWGRYDDASALRTKTPFLLNFGPATDTPNGNPPTRGNPSTGLSYTYLDLSQTATPNVKGPRFVIIGLSKIEGNEWATDTTNPLDDPNKFNIVDVVCLDHFAKNQQL